MHIMHQLFANKPERALLQEDSSSTHTAKIVAVHQHNGYLDKCFDLSCIRGQVLGLGLSKAALWGDGVASDVQGWKPGELLCQHDCPLAHGFQHVQKSVSA